jgi:hypothetical protein
MVMEVMRSGNALERGHHVAEMADGHADLSTSPAKG